ncbi:MAG: hypothetical protein LUH09_09360 [Clostridiales bacterium]|nr:hypothetical protein [Clostridiales bacterium]
MLWLAKLFVRSAVGGSDWVWLSDKETGIVNKLIEAAVSDEDNPFVPMKYTDMTGEMVTKTVYFGTPSYTVYSGADNLQWVKDVEVEGIEQ